VRDRGRVLASRISRRRRVDLERGTIKHIELSLTFLPAERESERRVIERNVDPLP
jgi:hypothetical protein